MMRSLPTSHVPRPTSSLQPPASSLLGHCAAAILCVLAATRTGSFAADVRTELAAAHSAFSQRLSSLAETCDSQGLVEEARFTRNWNLPVDPHRFFPVTLDGEMPSDVDASAAWPAEFRGLRNKQADALFELASRAADEEDVFLAYRLVWAAVRENPDHEAARRALGHRNVEGQWLTRFEADKRRADQTWHERFGWLRADDVPRYENGERFYAGSWISAEQEAEIRSNMTRAWSVATENFVVKTNHSLQAGVRLAARLERLHDVWRQLFVGYYATPREIKQMIGGRPLRPHSPRRHQVVYFQNRDQYNDQLQRQQPNIDITTGIYLGDSRTAYFFASDEEDHGTQYHEVTHQLFSECRPVVNDIGRDANFWIVEGVACYMESLGEHQGHLSVGGLETERLIAARYRLLEDGFYVPLAEFNTLGMLALQRDPRIRTLYSQATGWTHFLIHCQDGLYRPALDGYLLAVYTGRDRVGTLAELTGTNYETLDRQYREYFEELPQ